MLISELVRISTLARNSVVFWSMIWLEIQLQLEIWRGLTIIFNLRTGSKFNSSSKCSFCLLWILIFKLLWPEFRPPIFDVDTFLHSSKLQYMPKYLRTFGRIDHTIIVIEYIRKVPAVDRIWTRDHQLISKLVTTLSHWIDSLTSLSQVVLIVMKGGVHST
jgi:hypothetical protein